MNNELLTKNYCKPATGNWQLYSTTVENPLQISPFMQNKANFPDALMNVNKVLTTDYDNKTLGEHGKNEPKTNPNKANTKPIKANKMPKQTQYEPKQTQLVLRSLWRSRNKPNSCPPSVWRVKGKKMPLRRQSASWPSCGNGCRDKICNTLIDLALH